MKIFNVKKLVIAVVIILSTYSSFAQNFYAGLNGGYNWGSASFASRNSTQVGNITTYDRVQISLGQGVNMGASVGYKLNKFLGAEMGVSYLISSSITTENKRTSGSTSTTNTLNFSSTMLSFIPTLLITPGFEKINPYAKLGLILGLGTFTRKSEDISSAPNLNSNNSSTRLYNGGLAIGLISSFGAAYKINEAISLFGEFNLINLSYSPTKSEITQSKENGVDNLSTMSTRDKVVEYSDSYSEDSSIPANPNAPRKASSESLPFSSIGVNIGISYSF